MDYMLLILIFLQQIITVNYRKSLQLLGQRKVLKNTWLRWESNPRSLDIRRNVLIARPKPCGGTFQLYNIIVFVSPLTFQLHTNKF